MKLLSSLFFCMLLAGCAHDQGVIAEPTVVQFGDSVSLGASGPARFYLDGIVDFRHDAWEDEDIAPSKTPYFYEQVVIHGRNIGPSANMLKSMEDRLAGTHYTMIVMNAGLHDIQGWHDGVYTGAFPISVYRNNLEGVAQLAEQHADIVVWVNTTPTPTILGQDGVHDMYTKGEEVPFNEAADSVAHEHGFYILETTDEGQRPGNIHFTGHGYDLLGKHIADCVLTALNQQESAICHK